MNFFARVSPKHVTDYIPLLERCQGFEENNNIRNISYDSTIRNRGETRPISPSPPF